MHASSGRHQGSDETPFGFGDLQCTPEHRSSEDLNHLWNMNYHEASIYLEEGENNDKFDFHPRSKGALPAYNLVHNSWFYSLDLVAALLLMGLAVSEKPAVPGFALPEWLHASLELLCLSVMAGELTMKLRWMGFKPFLHHKRTVIKVIVLVVMVVEALVVLGRQASHIRVTRALRPVFLIDNHYCKVIRRVIRQIMQSLPPILDMLSLLLFFMLIFSVLGFYLFSGIKEDPYFSTLQKSFVSLFVLLTTANFPDVMMPSYAKSKWSCLFFISFLIIHLYFLMNLMLPVVYETFTNFEKEKFRKLLLHRKKACQMAFRLLVTRNNPQKMSFRHFEGLMKYYRPKNRRIDNYLMFKTLDREKGGTLTADDFVNVFEVSPLEWKPKRLDNLWFSHFSGIPLKIFHGIHKVMTWDKTEKIINFVILVNGIWQLLEAAQAFDQDGSPRNQSSTHVYVTSGFLLFYVVEIILKLVALGAVEYFSSNWNKFDFLVTISAAAGLIVEQFNFSFAYIIILRPLRLLRIFKVKKRYRDVLGTLFIILPRFCSVALVLVVVYYVFGVIGVELFSGYDLTNCCRNSTVEEYFHFENDSKVDGYYFLNNFDNFITSQVTLFELMVVNNWFILMDGYAYVASEWSRIFFMSFYIITMVVINIVVAFVLEAFLFRIQYKRLMGDMDKDMLARVDIGLSHQELEFCYSHSYMSLAQLLNYTDDLLCRENIIYRGTRKRTKFSFSLKMYEEEVKKWLKEEEEEEMEQRSKDPVPSINFLHAESSTQQQLAIEEPTSETFRF